MNECKFAAAFECFYASYDKVVFPKSARDLAWCYFEGAGCKKNTLVGAKLLINNNQYTAITSRIIKILDGRDRHDHLKELFLYGQIKDRKHNDATRFAYVVYLKSTTKAKQATLMFLWWAKYNTPLPRDMRRMIGEMIWESRFDPSSWDVGIDF